MRTIKDQHKILIVVPAYNEETNIRNVIQEIRSYDKSLTVLVVNDGSKDATSRMAQEAGAEVLNLPYNLGIGGAVQMGFIYALKNDFDFVVQVDGDGQHDITFMENIMEPLLNENIDMAIGSRFLPPYVGYRSSFVRRFGIHFFAFLISRLTQYTVTDPTSGFRAFNRKMIRIFAKYYPQDFPEPEAIAVAARYKSFVKEVPVRMRRRENGHSSIRYLRTLYYMVKVTFALFLDKLKGRGQVVGD
ncbi:MAG: glycosyltransferase family 2 protein [Candidatus Omnitrophica bacterium]|nr:glycosyltransferase family 2 protein [Candidatus Omnitrophota bacterium]